MKIDMTEKEAIAYRDLTGHFPSPLFPDHFLADEGQVFVEVDDLCFQEVKESKAYPEKIIKCAKCEKPAKRIDHLWPHYSDYNACKDCLKKEKRLKKSSAAKDLRISE